MLNIHRRSFMLALGAVASTVGAGPALANHLRYARTGAYVVWNPYARAQNNWNRPDVRRLIMFGDSYTTTVDRARTYLWGVHLVNEGSVRELGDFAKLAATAANLAVGGQIRSLAMQVKAWAPEAPTLGPRDLIVVYFGQNDIFQFSSVSASLVDLAAGLDRLIALGATASGRRLLLVLLHDVRRNPNAVADIGPRYLAWVPAVAQIAGSRPNVLMVDLTTTFNFVFANPSYVGLTNVTTADATRSSTTALYMNGGHFGFRGHQLISQIVRYYLTRGWDCAHQLLPGSAEMTKRLVEDIRAGNVFRKV